jgi:glycosyltransferase involved in cell wall biosynthesis
MDTPKINILTRTSNRPNFFKRNVESIRSQTYKNVRHIVSCDNDSDLEYINRYDDVIIVRIDKDKLISEDNSINPKTGKYSPHNLYFNEMLKVVDDGWVIILDDDDLFIDEYSLETISKYLDNVDDMVIWQMKFIGDLLLPPINELNSPPKLGRIGSPCFTFNIDNLGDVKWDGWKCGDFRFINNIYNKSNKVISIPKVLVDVTNIGSGNKVDL